MPASASPAADTLAPAVSPAELLTIADTAAALAGPLATADLL